eukprot:Polyplicarium_translucidae@DN3274_c18_g11_i1.p4
MWDRFVEAIRKRFEVRPSVHKKKADTAVQRPGESVADFHDYFFGVAKKSKYPEAHLVELWTTGLREHEVRMAVRQKDPPPGVHLLCTDGDARLPAVSTASPPNFADSVTFLVVLVYWRHGDDC